MDAAEFFPRRCRKSIRVIRSEIGTTEETAYAMMLMTATLMDLQPEDDAVLHAILCDCGIEDPESA